MSRRWRRPEHTERGASGARTGAAGRPSTRCRVAHLHATMTAPYTIAFRAPARNGAFPAWPRRLRGRKISMSESSPRSPRRGDAVEARVATGSKTGRRAKPAAPLMCRPAPDSVRPRIAHRRWCRDACARRRLRRSQRVPGRPCFRHANRRGVKRTLLRALPLTLHEPFWIGCPLGPTQEGWRGGPPAEAAFRWAARPSCPTMASIPLATTLALQCIPGATPRHPLRWARWNGSCPAHDHDSPARSAAPRLRTVQLARSRIAACQTPSLRTAATRQHAARGDAVESESMGTGAPPLGSA